MHDLTLNWDLTASSASTVDRYSVSFSTAQHAIAYGIDLTEVFTQAVPEPSTWAMLIAGVAGLLVFGHRRRLATVVG